MHTSRITMLGIVCALATVPAQLTIVAAQTATTQAAQAAPTTDQLQSLLSGLNIGPMMMTVGGASGFLTDFTRSTERNLLKRHDVRSELFLNSKQCEDFDSMDVDSKQAMQKRIMESVMKNVQTSAANIANSAQQGSGGPPDLTAVKDTINEAFQGIQEAMQTFQTEQDSKFEAQLTEKQKKRLRELDLQWRGLLSLSDKAVAELMSETPTQKTVVEAALKTYQTAQVAAIQPVMNSAIKLGQDAAKNGGQIPQGFNPNDMQKKMMEALEGDALKKVRVASEDKIRAVLTTDQAATWKKLVGVKFVFRTND